MPDKPNPIEVDNNLFDPFLKAHKVQFAAYDLSAGLYPGSIRDQIIRATILVDRLREWGFIEADLRPLLIIGAGVAGITSAFTAFQHDVECMVIDKNVGSFQRYLGCSSRFLDPIEYDWPLPHFNEGRFPWPRPEDHPLGFYAGPPSLIAAGWRSTLLAFLDLPKPVPFTVQYSTIATVERDPADQSMWLASFQNLVAVDETFITSKKFGAIIIATGPGKEQTSIKGSAFETYAFWTDDPYSEISASNEPQNILISGAGDGGLQEYVRLLTKATDKATADLSSIAKQLLSKITVPEQLKWSIQFEQENADRSFAWGASTLAEEFVHTYLTGRDHSLYSSLDTFYNTATQRLVNASPEVRDALLSNLLGA